MATAQEIIDISYTKSKRNVPGVQSSETGELLPLLHRSLSGLFAVGARLNRYFFASSEDVTYSNPGWARPTSAEAVFGIEKSDGTEIVVVPREQKQAEPGKPSVYRWGQIYRIANANGTDLQTSDDLTFFFSKVPDALPDLTSDIDSLWPESYNELLALELAIYNALKEGGQRAQEEVPPLKQDRDRWLQRFVMMLEHETVGERRSYGHVQVFNTSTLVPLSSIVAGGTNVLPGGQG